MNEKIVFLAGNPNVGKSSIFNALTGLKQHTGNWSGKTVDIADGEFTYKDKKIKIIDLPGTYSLEPASYEEEISVKNICFADNKKIIVVCDATLLERNLYLLLQICEVTDNVTLCLNLMDEAKKSDIKIDIKKLRKILNIPVIETSMRSKEGLNNLKNDIINDNNKTSYKTEYLKEMESAITIVKDALFNQYSYLKVNFRYLAINLLCNNDFIINMYNEKYNIKINDNNSIKESVAKAEKILEECNYSSEKFKKNISLLKVLKCEDIANEVFIVGKQKYELTKKIDSIITNKYLAFPFMILFLSLIFFITMSLSNYPSELLSMLFNYIEEKLVHFAIYLKIPEFIYSFVIFGIYRVVAWITAVMLPPMAIFFPLFSIFEDLGLLPRIAFNFDRLFSKCSSCGKQALTMCMGFGCNSVGVIGARIIDSERERLIAIITNSFVPCNGRFPMLFALIGIFFLNEGGAFFSNLVCSLIMTSIILLSVVMTFLISKILSLTVLKGEKSCFIMEMPKFRKPQIIKSIIFSVKNRIIFVLYRALIVAVPCGALIFILANLSINNIPLINIICDFFNTYGLLLGLNGVIIAAFVLGFPANEIVLPLIFMIYMSNGILSNYESLNVLKETLINNGWTIKTAVCTIVFALFHFPCSTTMLSIYKETKSIKYTLLSFFVPLTVGTVLCFVLNFLIP